MKEFNKPTEEEKPEKPVETKPKQPRPYIAISESELEDMGNMYRKLMRLETQTELIDLLRRGVENVERELRLRSKLKTVKS